MCDLGEISKSYTEPTSENSFSSGFERACYLLKTRFINSTIIYIRSHNMSSRLYDRQIAYGEQGIKIAEKWGIGVIDLYKYMNTQITDYQIKYLSDYTHPNELGYNSFYVPSLEKYLYEHRNSEY